MIFQLFLEIYDTKRCTKPKKMKAMKMVGVEGGKAEIPKRKRQKR